MNTAKDADPAAQFVRRLLQMNPAYGRYLCTDPELAGSVQVFAKKFRTKIMQAESPIQLGALFQPLCELVWRVVGIVMHSIFAMDQSMEDLPVPKEATGQVKMLLQSNIELSHKLNESRRAYLRELTQLRDKQRTINEQAQNAITSLQEQPVIFFEPLEFVLDDTTKEFVKEVVEERVKLEMRTRVVGDDASEEVKFHVVELEQEVKAAQAELRVQRNTAAREADARKRHEEVETRLREEIKKERESKIEVVEELKDKLDICQSDLRQSAAKVQFLEGEVERYAAAVDSHKNDVSRLEFSEHEQDVRSLRDKCANLGKEASKYKEEVGKLGKEIERLEAEVVRAEGVAADAMSEVSALRDKYSNIIGNETLVDDIAMREQLEKSLEVETELRAANLALEKALKEEQIKHKTNAQNALEDQDAMNAATAHSIKKATEKRDREIEQQNARIALLQETITDLQEELKGKSEVDPEAASKKTKSVCDIDKDEKWKQKFLEMEVKHDDLAHEYAILEQKVQMLLEKLKEKCGDDEVGHVLMKIKLTAPPPKKARKKKAFERLYDDAQRRIIEMRSKQERLKKAEEQALITATSKVKDRQSLHKVEMLTHLQKAASATSARFHDAISNFHQSDTGSGGTTLRRDPDDSDDLEPVSLSGTRCSTVLHFSPTRGRKLERCRSQPNLVSFLHHVALDVRLGYHGIVMDGYSEVEVARVDSSWQLGTNKQGESDTACDTRFVSSQAPLSLDGVAKTFRISRPSPIQGESSETFPSDVTQMDSPWSKTSFSPVKFHPKVRSKSVMWGTTSGGEDECLAATRRPLQRAISMSVGRSPEKAVAAFAGPKSFSPADALGVSRGVAAEDAHGRGYHSGSTISCSDSYAPALVMATMSPGAAKAAGMLTNTSIWKRASTTPLSGARSSLNSTPAPMDEAASIGKVVASDLRYPMPSSWGSIPVLGRVPAIEPLEPIAKRSPETVTEQSTSPLRSDSRQELGPIRRAASSPRLNQHAFLRERAMTPPEGSIIKKVVAMRKSSSVWKGIDDRNNSSEGARACAVPPHNPVDGGLGMRLSPQPQPPPAETAGASASPMRGLVVTPTHSFDRCLRIDAAAAPRP